MCCFGALIWPERTRMENMLSFDPVSILTLTRSLSLKLLGAVVAIMAIVAAIDYLLAYRQWYERQKMSLRELKDEFKRHRGDPKIKARIRQLRHERMKKRMMSAVPKATVVITNPTHFAVALQYERGMNAPICVAGGRRCAGAENPRSSQQNMTCLVIENPPLASCSARSHRWDIDEEIPAEHYKAVAEVIGYVLRLKTQPGAR